MNQLKNLLCSTSITHKLWAGFGLMLILLAVVAINTLFSLADTEEKVGAVTEEIQPTLLASMALKTSLKEASNALGFYMLTKEAAHKEAYLANLAQVDTALHTLEQTPVAQQNPDTQQIIQGIKERVAAFKAYKDQMLELASDVTKNSAALGYSVNNLNPQSQAILQTLAEMLGSEDEEELTEQRHALAKTLQDLRYTWATLMNNLRMYVFLGNEEARANMELFMEGSSALVDKVHEFEDILTFEQEEGIAVLEENRQIFAQNLKTLVALHQGEKAQTDAYLIRTEIGPILSAIDNDLNALVDDQRNQIDRHSSALRDQAKATTGLVSSLLVVGLLVGILVAWLTTRIITRPLKIAVAAMKDIAEGEGDLTQRLAVNGRDEIASLAKGFNQFASNIQQLLHEVSSSADQIASSAQAMDDVSSTAEQNIQRQNAETEQISTAVEEMSVTAREVAQNAELTSEAARQADAETHSGRQVVNTALDAVSDLANETQAAAQAIEKLGNDIEGISSVIDVIRGVAEQTNLLALNAAIEAARAGEQGRGFAVVADEVRTLASRTQESTQQIQAKVESLQVDAHQAVEKMLKNRQSADATIELTGKAGTSLESITQSVERITDMSQQIASAAEEQSSVANMVSENLVTITQLAQATDDSTQQVFANTKGLNEFVGSLRGCVGRFKV